MIGPNNKIGINSHILLNENSTRPKYEQIYINKCACTNFAKDLAHSAHYS